MRPSGLAGLLLAGLAQAGSLLTHDQTMAYRAPDDERTMLYHYRRSAICNRGMPRAPWWREVRRANQVQEQALKARAAEVRAVEEEHLWLVI